MNINDVSSVLKPVEPKLMEPKLMEPKLMEPKLMEPKLMEPASVEPSIPASEPDKIEAAEKNNTREEEQKKESSIEETKQLAEELNEYMDDIKTTLGFSIREDHRHQMIVEIKNRETDELIKQIPSEELLAIKEKIEEFTGLIFNQKV